MWHNPMTMQHYVTTHVDDLCYLIPPLDHNVDFLQHGVQRHPAPTLQRGTNPNGDRNTMVDEGDGGD